MKRYQNTATDSARWRLYEPRPDDIIITTPPKAGTTLTQMLCALVIFDSPDLPEPLDDLSPWFDMLTRSDADAVDAITRQEHRRFIKTHTPMDGIPLYDEVTYVCVGRDPRDLLASWEHHSANMDRDAVFAAMSDAGTIEQALQHRGPPQVDLVDRVDTWLDNDSENATMSLAMVANHFQQSWDRRDMSNVLLFHFDDLKADRACALKSIADAIGVDLSAERAAELAGAAELGAMREQAHRLAPETKLFKDPAKFFRSGQGGEWESYTTPDQRDTYERRVAELLSQDLSEWIHRQP